MRRMPRSAGFDDAASLFAGLVELPVRTFDAVCPAQ